MCIRSLVKYQVHRLSLVSQTECAHGITACMCGEPHHCRPLPTGKGCVNISLLLPTNCQDIAVSNTHVQHALQHSDTTMTLRLARNHNDLKVGKDMHPSGFASFVLATTPALDEMISRRELHQLAHDHADKHM